MYNFIEIKEYVYSGHGDKKARLLFDLNTQKFYLHDYYGDYIDLSLTGDIGPTGPEGPTGPSESPTQYALKWNGDWEPI